MMSRSPGCSSPALLRWCSRAFSVALTFAVLPAPIEGLAIEIQRTTLPSTIADVAFQRISFVSNGFSSSGITPVVLTVATNQGGNPCAIRIQNVDTTGFDAACVEPPSLDGRHVAMDLHYIAIEAGVHAVPATVGGLPTTVTLAAGTVSTSQVQHGCPPACGATGSTSVLFGTTFSAPPALLLQIQTLASESGMPPSTASMPFLVATTVDSGGSPVISTTGFDVALERSEVAAGTVSAEVVGWLAAAPTAGCTLLDFSSFGGPASVPFESLISGSVVDGWSDGCNAGEGVTFSAGCFASPPVVVGTKRTRNGADGGWLRRCTAGFGTGAVRFTVDEDTAGDAERSHILEAVSALAFDTDFSTPVGLAFFHAEPIGSVIRLRWATSTEAGSIGFTLSAWDGSAWMLIEGAVQAASGIDTTVPQNYALTLPAAAGSRFRLSETDRFGRVEHHGPFDLGIRYGSLPVLRAVDWQAIRAQLGRHISSRQIAQHTSSRKAELRVSETGIYRVSHQALLDGGIDLRGVSASAIALTLAGEPVARRVVGANAAGRWAAASSLEFWGRAIENSLYTRTRVYRLEVDRRHVRPMAIDRRRAPAGAAPASYREQLIDDANRQYSFGSPNGDPWFRDSVLAFGGPRSLELQISVEGLVEASRPRLVVDLWGVTDFPVAPDHHLEVALNGVTLSDEVFDGLREVNIDLPLPAGLLVEGSNTLTLNLPADLGVAFDLVHLERFGVAYSRRFMVRDDELTFTGRGRVFQVGGFSTPEIVAYRLVGDEPTFLEAAVTSEDNVYSVRLRGIPAHEVTYVVAAVDHLRPVDDIRPAAEVVWPSGEASYLIISHPAFLHGLGDLIAARRADGWSVEVADVESIYAAHSHGVVDPGAIRHFIANAERYRGTRMVLLVGADTYDYFDYSGVGSMSFVPTLYAQTDSIVRFAPADALLADTDDDGIPDLPIGRLPVRTRAELANVISKILAYERGLAARTAVLVADGQEPMTSFSAFSDSLDALLPTTWTRQTVHLDELPVAEARQALLSALEDGPDLVSFVGHSSARRWTFDGLFSDADAASLGNARAPIVMQGGCWNTYHVEPSAETLAHRFLTGPHGAVAVIGPAVLTRFESERRLEVPFLEGLVVGGLTIGEALQAAKRTLSQEAPGRLDALLGWSLLGDPALRLE